VTRASAGSLADHVLAIEINAPRQRVWDEITKTGRIQRAVMNTVLECTLAPGRKLRYYSPDRRRVFVVGEIVAVEPPRRFAHTFMFTTRPERPSLVTWELEDIPGGCRVTLTHSGWTDQSKTHGGVRDGWRRILDLLKREVETGDIPFGTKLNYRVLGALAFLLPRATRTEEVERAGW
jgi:uncharacterized protein YndB with AHSA1/START domain